MTISSENSQDSEYVPRYNYGSVLNIPAFRVCQVSAYAHGSEYV